MKATQTHTRTLVISGIAAIILQIVLAPNIALFSVVPNFIMVAVVVMALRASALQATIYGFLLGFCYDMLSQSPVGVMTLILTIAAYALSTISKGSLESDTVMEGVAIFLVLLVGELVHGILLAVIGYDHAVFHSLLFRSLPGALYEIILAGIVYFIMSRFTSQTSSKTQGQLGSAAPGRKQKTILGKGRSSGRKLR